MPKSYQKGNNLSDHGLFLEDTKLQKIEGLSNKNSKFKERIKIIHDN